MCGRYVIYDELTEDVATLLGVTFPVNFNAAPTQLLPIILNNSRGDPELIQARWGLLPRWAEGPKKIKPFFNARADNLPGNKVFWSSRDRHCIVPMKGFYEWSEHDKQPYYIFSPENKMLSVAGLWRQWTDGVDVLDTFCIITTTPHPVVRDIHHRSPVILDESDCDAWLTKRYSKTEHLLAEYTGELVKHSVSKAVNSSRIQLTSLIDSII